MLDRAADLGENGQLVLAQGRAWCGGGNRRRAGHVFQVAVPIDLGLKC